MKDIAALIFTILFSLPILAQTASPSDTIYIDSSYIVNMDPVLITTTMSQAQIDAYKKLKRNVKIAMPYAKLSAYKLRAMEYHLNTLTRRREKKLYIKACEENLKQLFTDNLKNMTIDQGKILMKLIHRETGNTTWTILKKYRGGLEAVFYQSFGAIYGHNMKIEFDPVMDFQIENIIRVENLE